ncbi:hypothetical protein [Hymenobacter tenuis]
MNLDSARARVEPLILTGSTHADYARCVEHATLCRKLATGDTDSLLQQFSREEDEDFAVRKQLTVAVSPAIWDELRKPFYQVSRLSGAQIDKRLDYPAELSDAERLRRVSLLTGALDAYYDRKPQEDYLSKHIIRSVALTDPNAWLLTEFGAFDFRTQRPRPYPVLFKCEAVVDFTREAGEVTSVTFRTKVAVENVEGLRYTMYLADEALDFWPVLTVGTNTISTLPEGSRVAGELRDPGTGNLLCQYRILQHRAGRVPALPIGYIPDELTEDRTFVSPLNAALCYLQMELKTGSELQIVMSQIAHPHKAQFVNRCAGAPGNTCNNGLNRELQTCTVCNGTTRDQIATSALDTLTVPLPKDLSDIKIKLTEMVAYTAPGTDVPRLQIDYQTYLTDRAKQVLFGTQLLSKTSTTQTATERLAQLAQLNTALTPMADQFSALWVHGAYVAAGYLDVQTGLEPVYDFPPGLELADVSDLEAAYAEAVKAGMPAFYLEQQLKDIIRRRFATNPEELRKFTIKARFIPFLGLSEDAVLKLATLGYCSAEERVLRTHADSIFTELELADPTFYDLGFQAQQAAVTQKAQEVLGRQATTAAPVVSSAFRALTTTPPQGVAPSVGVAGTRVTVKPDGVHQMDGMGMGGAGTVEIVSPEPALGVRLDSMPDEVHKWYVASELTLEKS